MAGAGLDQDGSSRNGGGACIQNVFFLIDV